MLPRPPGSTLFPTRRSSDLGPSGQLLVRCRRRTRPAAALFVRGSALPTAVPLARDGPEQTDQQPKPRTPRPSGRRSEEHTSELQSQSNLVCRLLLEKKNKSS